MIRSVSKEQTADGVIEILRLTDKDTEKMRNQMGVKEEKGLPHLEVQTHDGNIILLMNCKEP